MAHRFIGLWTPELISFRGDQQGLSFFEPRAYVSTRASSAAGTP